MRPEDIQKLLGGYATGTLTDAEQQALFAAALEDQGLFDALAREQSLRDLLRDPAAKAQLLAALDERPKHWRWWRPAAALAVAGVAAVAVIVVRQKAPQQPAGMIAEARPQAPQPLLPPPETPAPRPALPAPKTSAPPASRPASRQKAFQAPPVPAPAAAAIAEAPKLERAEPRPFPAGVAGGVMGGMIGGVPPAPIPAQPPPRAALLPEESRVSVAAMQARVEVTRPSAHALFFGIRTTPVRVQTGDIAAESVAQLLGVRYSILRKQGDDFVEADPQSLKPDDTIELRFTSNANGYLSLAGAAPVALTAMRPYTTAPLPPDRNEVKVVFSRQPQRALSAPAALATEVRDRETYVVNTSPASELGFTVALKRK